MPTIKEIKVFYRLKPKITVWSSKTKGVSHRFWLLEETWYNGDWFRSGYFFYIQLKFVAIHVRVKWWDLKILF